MNDQEKERTRKIAADFPRTKDYPDQIIEQLMAADWTIVPPHTPPALTPEQLADKTRYLCQYCGTYKPDLMFQLQTQILGGIGLLQWVIISCTHCRRIQTHAVLYFQPDPALTQSMQQMIQGAIDAQKKGGLLI